MLFSVFCLALIGGGIGSFAGCALFEIVRGRT